MFILSHLRGIYHCPHGNIILFHTISDPMHKTVFLTCFNAFCVCFIVGLRLQTRCINVSHNSVLSIASRRVWCVRRWSQCRHDTFMVCFGQIRPLICRLFGWVHCWCLCVYCTVGSSHLLWGTSTSTIVYSPLWGHVPSNNSVLRNCGHYVGHLWPPLCQQLQSIHTFFTFRN